MKTTVVGFSFDAFGSAGTAEGANLIFDAIREMLADNRREKRPSRSQAYSQQIRLKEYEFLTPEAIVDWRRTGQRAVREVLRRGERLIWLSGNHLGTLPVYDELAGRADVLIVQIDAHLDIYDFNDCFNTLSHGNFLRHAAQPLPAVVQLGHRDLFIVSEEIHKYFEAHFSARAISCDETQVLRELGQRLKHVSHVYLDIDCDGLDPADFPAVAGPMPFGLRPEFLLRLLRVIGRQKLAGVLLSEFLPAQDVRDRSLGITLWLLESIFLDWYEMG